MNSTVNTDEHERRKAAQLVEIKARYKRGETAWHMNDIALLLSLIESGCSSAQPSIPTYRRSKVKTNAD